MRLVEDDYTGPRAATLGCPSPDVLIALGGDALPEELRQHGRGTPGDVRGVSGAGRRPGRPSTSSCPSRSTRVCLSQASAGGAGWRAPLLAMAAVLVAAVALGVIYRKRPDEGARSWRASTRPPPRRRSRRQAGTWTIAKPALLLPLATALVVRGEAEEASRALGAALAPYRTDDYVEAERLLEAVVEKYPASADAWFYLGSTRLLDGDPAGAREALAEARTRGVGDRDDEAAWLLATAEARLGRARSGPHALDHPVRRQRRIQDRRLQREGSSAVKARPQIYSSSKVPRFVVRVSRRTSHAPTDRFPLPRSTDSARVDGAGRGRATGARLVACRDHTLAWHRRVVVARSR